MSGPSVTIAEKNAVITKADYGRLRDLTQSEQYRTSQPLHVSALEQELGRRTVVDSRKVPKGVVTMHSVVRVRDLKTKESDNYTLVYPQEADIDQGKISVLAPMGRALLRGRVGETVTFDAPAGRRWLKIVKILYQPEAAGNFDQ